MFVSSWHGPIFLKCWLSSLLSVRHVVMPLKLVWRLCCISSTLWLLVYMVESSANMWMLLLMCSGWPFMYKVKNNGPKIEPWGTPSAMAEVARYDLWRVLHSTCEVWPGLNCLSFHRTDKCTISPRYTRGLLIQKPFRDSAEQSRLCHRDPWLLPKYPSCGVVLARRSVWTWILTARQIGVCVHVPIPCTPYPSQPAMASVGRLIKSAHNIQRVH